MIEFRSSFKVLKETVPASLKVATLRIVVPTPLYGGSLPIARHAADAFKTLGHDVNVIDFEDQYTLFKRCEALRSSLNSSVPIQANVASLLADIVAATAIESHADLVWFTAQSPISPSALKTLSQAGVKTAMWYVEDFRRYEYWKALVGRLDAVFTIQDGEVSEAMRQHGARNIYYLPAAANPRVHFPRMLSPEQKKRFASSVSFVGAGYQNRVEFFERNKIEGLRIWGNDWPSQFSMRREEEGRRLSAEETAIVYCGTDVNINLHSSANGGNVSHGDFVNPRTFEIAACEAFQVCDTQASLNRLFEAGVEIATVSSEREMLSVIEYFRNRPDLRKKISRAGYERVMREHTYEHRLTTALNYLGVVYPEMNRMPRRSRFMEELIEAAQSDREVAEYLEERSRGECSSLHDLVSGIPITKQELTRPELLILTLHEFRQWGIEKGVVS